MKRKTVNHLLWAVGAAALLFVAAGCEQALFPDEMPRTQYERYDRLRGRVVPNERYTATGQPEPALRERLSPYAQ